MVADVGDELLVGDVEADLLDTALAKHTRKGGNGGIADFTLIKTRKPLDAEGDSHKPLSRPRRQAGVGDAIAALVGGVPNLCLHHALIISNIRSQVKPIVRPDGPAEAARRDRGRGR